jgi:uncharacterized caspase-like protein
MAIAIALLNFSPSKAFCSDTKAMVKNELKSKKLALLVGINDYPYVTKLKGAVNDVENMRHLLVERFGFPDDDEHMLVLTNKKATRDAILRGLTEHLIARATPDAIVVFHYSGHGSRIKDVSGDEIDNWDETIVAYDSGHQDPHPNRDITDDELLELLNQLTEKTPNVTFIFDSCHSGTVTRGSGLARQIEPDERPPEGPKSAPAAASRGVDEGKSGLRPANARHAVISGATSAESAYEMEVNGKHYGTLTWYLVEQLRLAGQNATYRDIMDQVKKAVTAKYWAQHPQLEGPGEDQLVFGTRSLAPLPYVPVKSNPDGTITLAAGQVQGVTKGSTYDVYPPGAKSFGTEAKSIARVEITEVEPTFAKWKIIQGGPVPDAARAVEREHHWPDSVLRVHFMFKDPKTKAPVQSATLQKIRKGLQKFKHIISVPTANGYDLLLREQQDAQTGKRYIITEGGDPTEISPRVPAEDPGAVAAVVEQITHWAKWFNVLQINNQNSDLNLEFILKPHGPAAARGDLVDREVNLSLSKGEQFTIQITNKSQKEIYIALLDLCSDGKVDLVFPRGGEQELMEPGKTLTKTLRTTLPDGRDSIRDVLKLVATISYADFRFLKQPAVHGGQKLADTRGKPANPLEELLAGAAMGVTRGVEEVEVGNWSTVDRVLEVKSK